ncbi:MAG TPA: tRNA adenosine(34) deaminase TadA [Candidatus Agrococcus pullicola]|uniref:tRNA-specific adenosine deaminase n=1 Tax=Candidatus Agrococcus pullicola TaxID=2838429 RepID=A0A9D1YSA3_9MICO|nr:tRNA adenosine(34) deaminase TadA [Candidatus Agrococcus pullicola]
MRVDPAYETHMRRAMALARLAAERDPQDVPVGAVLLDESGIEIASGANVRELRSDPTGHAELVAMRSAARMREDWHLDACTLVVTLEPCPMCAGAIAQSRLGRVVFGAWDEKAGAAGSVVDLLRDRRLPHRVEVVGGVLEQECAEQLRAFFTRRRT